jgi:hypothetical protein
MIYTTIQALRDFGSFDSSHDDFMLNALASAATRMIEQFCQRRFKSEADSDHIFRVSQHQNPFRGDMLLLDDDLAAEASSISGSPTVYYLDPYRPPFYAIISESGWSPPVTVTGPWAYSKEPPADIEFCCLRLAKWSYELRETTRGDAVVVTTQGAVLLPAKLPADVVAILAPYRRVGIGSPR